MQMTSVDSSNISAIGYDPATQELQVEFKNGTTYSYQGVTEGQYQELLNAPSVGRYFMANIRGTYPGTAL